MGRAPLAANFSLRERTVSSAMPARGGRVMVRAEMKSGMGRL